MYNVITTTVSHLKYNELNLPQKYHSQDSLTFLNVILLQKNKHALKCAQRISIDRIYFQIYQKNLFYYSFQCT